MSLKTRKRIKVQWTFLFYHELKIKERIEVRWSEAVWGRLFQPELRNSKGRNES